MVGFHLNLTQPTANALRIFHEEVHTPVNGFLYFRVQRVPFLMQTFLQRLTHPPGPLLINIFGLPFDPMGTIFI